ncbi:DNA modification methylase [Alistipes timonensis JC136]|uniref:Methyltransferase n=1 Tax=Alistipes timonensis JC136 TaxID=1033731 RepID=A0A1H4F262_9BACT|nr:site-specific DNA-methyltransferase [Alistipes timonensis]SEA91070.1 DNA modification methylase [Alistipes timonensis JC136]
MKFEKGTTSRARLLTNDWIKSTLPDLFDFIKLGLPEYDDRLELWRVSLNTKNSKQTIIGEIKLDKAVTKIVDWTKKDLIIKRLNKSRLDKNKDVKKAKNTSLIYPAPIPNKIILGDCIQVLDDFPPDTAQLIITSPPYYNAKPEYSEYIDYQEYLDFLRRVIVRCHNILSEGRFFVINVSPVLIKRVSRNSASKRIPIPFDIHKILDSVGFDFIDDIMWVKPEGAGWNLGRGRRFAADRQPLQYKPVPVTEYILVYRKRTDKLIDWNIRNHYNQELVKESKIVGDYDKTNLWYIHPSHNKYHPATFPDELVSRVIRYYSFEDDLVLDPFGGSGTVARVALQMKRRFLLVEKEPEYFQLMKKTLSPLFSPDLRVDFDIFENDKI